MNKTKTKIICSIAITISLIASSFSFALLDNGKTYAATKTTVATPFGFSATRYSHTATTLKWNKVKGVTGYKVYSYNTKTKKYKLIKTIKGSSKTKWVRKGLKTNKWYYYGLRAYKKINGKNVYSPYSYRISSKPHNKKSKYVNVSKVAIGYKSATLGMGMKKTFSASLYLSKAKIKVKQKVFSKSVRWYSSNKSMATVKNGTIQAKYKTGTCYIYAIAHNGAKCKLILKVKNYAKPSSFNLGGIKKSIGNILMDKNKEDVCDIATYFTIHRPKETITMTLDDNENFIVSPKIDLGAIEETVKQFLMNQEYLVSIKVDSGEVEFIIREYLGSGPALDPSLPEEDWYSNHRIKYFYNTDRTEENLLSYEKRIAPHWIYSLFIPD